MWPQSTVRKQDWNISPRCLQSDGCLKLELVLLVLVYPFDKSCVEEMGL